MLSGKTDPANILLHIFLNVPLMKRHMTSKKLGIGLKSPHPSLDVLPHTLLVIKPRIRPLRQHPGCTPGIARIKLQQSPPKYYSARAVDDTPHT